MKKLWAPWRLSFILGPKSKGCLFCQLPKAKKDRKNLILYRGRYHYIILNKYPYNNGHLMVVPFRHVKDLHRLTPGENAELMELCGVASHVLDRTMQPQGYNLGMNLGRAGGAGILNHLHMHLVPRWNGDTNYMPLLSETKILVEHIDDTYQRLAPAIEKVMKQKVKK
jgi:ATP adenylyltransferase